MIPTILLILVVAIVLILIARSYHPPKWKQVYDFIYELRYVHEEPLDVVEKNLVSYFNLTPHQAKLCVNNFGDVQWFTMQSFLE